MHHPIIIDVFAFQEALLVEVILAIAVIALAYRGFGRWLQHKERMGRLIAEQTAERAAQYGAHIGRVEARLKAVEQIVSDDGAQTAAEIDSLHTDPLPGAISRPDELQAP